MDIHARVSKNIKRLVKAKNIDFQTLAYDIDKDKGFLSRILSGKKRPNLALIQKIADVLEVDVQNLFKP